MKLTNAALLIVDLQNDFLHEYGAYARGGQTNADIAALPGKLKPLADLLRRHGGFIISTHFTLVPGRGGEPLISPHLKSDAAVPAQGRFRDPGAGVMALVDELAPSDFQIEKIAYSAFYMTRLEWVLRKAGIERLVVGGIVTNGGVASTVRDAHVRDIETIVLEDGSPPSIRETHATAIAALRPVAEIATIADILRDFA